MQPRGDFILWKGCNDYTPLLTVLQDWGFLIFPRKFGNPTQVKVNNLDTLLRHIKRTNGHAPCFTSHNAFSRFGQFGDPTDIIMSHMFFDYDEPTKPENAQLDAISAVVYARNLNIKYDTAFSGVKGFHVYYRMDDQDLPMDFDLKLKYHAIHTHMGTMTRTLDPKVRDPPRLCRIPGTENKHGQYCIPLSFNDLKWLTVPEIIELSKTPEIAFKRYLETRETGGEQVGINQMIKIMKIEKSYQSMKRKDPIEYTTTNYHGKEFNDEWMQWLSQIIWRPCIRQDLFSPNPGHFSRFCAATQLNMVCDELQEVFEIWDVLTEKCGHVDRFRTIGSEKVSHQQLRHIWNKPTTAPWGYGYAHPSCAKIKIQGLCIGEQCEYFRK